MGETLVTSLVGLATQIVAKICAYTPTPSWSIGAWTVLKAESRSCRLEPGNIYT